MESRVAVTDWPTNQIEVTEEMIEAGLQQYRDRYLDLRSEDRAIDQESVERDMVASVYVAMLSARSYTAQ